MIPVATLLLAARLAPPPSAGAFEFPMTRTQRAQKLVEEGQGLILRGDYLRAIDSCSRALDIRDDWAPAYLCRGEARLFAKDPAAGSDARKALSLDPTSGEPQRLLGIMDFEAGRFAPALDHFNLALSRIKLKPDGVPDVYFYRAKTRLNLGDLEAALKDVDQGLGVLQGVNGDFSDWSFYSLRAEILRRQKRTKKADEDERRVIRLIEERMRRRPMEVPDLLRRRAESYSLLRDYDKAAQDYGEILKGLPDDVKTLIDRAQALSLAGRHAEARRDLDRALELEPKQALAWRLRAMERIHGDDHAGAVRDLDAYLKLAPDDAIALGYRGVSKRFLGDWAGAVDDIDAAQRLDSADSALWGQKAYAQEMLGRHEEAFASAQKALAADPEDLPGHVARAQAGVMLRRCAEAYPSLEWLISKSPKSGQYRWLRGECRCDSGDFANGLQDLEDAAALEPQSAAMALRLAHQHRRFLETRPASGELRLRELRRSTEFFDRAAALGALEPQYRLERARSLSELGEALQEPSASPERTRLRKKAAEECAAVLKAEPRNRDARALLRRLRKPAAR